jgi:hypothetical protein
VASAAICALESLGCDGATSGQRIALPNHFAGIGGVVIAAKG